MQTNEELAGVRPGGLVEALDGDGGVSVDEPPFENHVGRLLSVLGDDIIRREVGRGGAELRERVLSKDRHGDRLVDFDALLCYLLYPSSVKF